MQAGKNIKEKYLSVTSSLANFLLILILMNAGVYAYASSFKPETMTMDYHGEKLSVAINSVPLNQVIKNFSQSTGVKVLWQGGEVERKIGMQFTHLSTDEAVRKILRRENYILYYTFSEGEKKLEKILIVSGEKERNESEHTPKTVPEPRLLAMAERAEELDEGYYEIEPVPFDEQEMAEAIEQLLSQGDTEAAEAMMQKFASDPNF